MGSVSLNSEDKPAGWKRVDATDQVQHKGRASFSLDLQCSSPKDFSGCNESQTYYNGSLLCTLLCNLKQEPE